MLAVSGTALAAQFTRGEKGEALGLFNAGSSLAGALGAFLGGWLMATAGYGTLCGLAAAMVGLVGVASITLLPPPAEDRAGQGQCRRSPLAD